MRQTIRVNGMKAFSGPLKAAKWLFRLLHISVQIKTKEISTSSFSGRKTLGISVLSIPWRFVLIAMLGLSLWPVSSTLCNAAEPLEIIVEGIEGDAKKNVLEALAPPPGLIKDGKVDRLWLERFVGQAEEKAKSSLEPFGYYSARVKINMETPKTNEYVLRVKVAGGPPVIVADASVSVAGPGASDASLQSLAAAFPLPKGAVLLQQTYERARRELQAKALELGYLDAEYTIHEIRIDAAATSARITLRLETGEKYFFSHVTIEGAPDYPDAFLRRFLTFAPGDAFSYAKLAASQAQLNSSQRFREVNILADKQTARDFKIPVRIILKPANRRSLMPGVGYGTDTGARVSLRYRDLNVFHKGHELDSNLYISERLQGLATSYIIPSDKDIRTFTSVQINLQKEDITTYDDQIVSLELARTKSIDTQKQGTLYVRFQQEAYTISDQNSSSRYVLPGIRFSDNHYDSMIRPSQGFRYALEVRGTSQALGSTTQLLQFIAQASHLLPLPWHLSLATSAQLGATVFSDPLNDIPPSLRFFAGGDRSVLGYAYQSLGPVDASGNVVGGKHLLTGCIELQRAISDKWAVSTFYNAGNAFDSFYNLTLYQAAGVGVHYYSPVGVLNLYLARQIGVEDPGYRIHFTVGFEF
jgi:translocation and assembly module TamA